MDNENYGVLVMLPFSVILSWYIQYFMCIFHVFGIMYCHPVSHDGICYVSYIIRFTAQKVQNAKRNDQEGNPRVT